MKRTVDAEYEEVGRSPHHAPPPPPPPFAHFAGVIFLWLHDGKL